MPDLSTLFDDFNLRARVYPTLLACAPALVNIVVLWQSSPLLRLAPLGVAVGALFFFSDVIRGAGQSTEGRLIAKWGELPAQRALWMTRAEHPEQTARRRAHIERLTGRRLPTSVRERRNPEATRREYDLAIREVIPLVRGKTKDELLHNENVRYNFRRNMLAIRPWAISLAVLVTTADGIAALFSYQQGSAVAALGVCLLLLAAWVLIVRESWVWQAGMTYANRFYEAIALVKSQEGDHDVV